MPDLRKLISELTYDEGLRLRPYRDSVGKLTIGYGRNLDDVGISQAEADAMLANDIARTMADLDRSLPWWRELDEVRQRVMVNLAFNLGADSTATDPRFRKLLEFKNTLAAVRAGNYIGAANGLRASRWATQVGARANRLISMMATGAAPGAAKPPQA